MPHFKLEQAFTGLCAGIDEAGRGPWAGPVVASAVCFPGLSLCDAIARQIKDSKKMTAINREKVFALLHETDALIGVGMASVDEIDTMNILQATFLAMHRACDQIEQRGHAFQMVLIDGNQTPKTWKRPAQCIIGGDDISLSIAAASIVAKVTRDRIMAKLASDFPMYGWDQNAGYGAPSHIDGLQKHGPCEHHRKSYAPIRKILENR